MKRLDVDENTSVSMPVRNLLTIIGSLLVGAWFAFGVIERLNSIESDLRLMSKDLEAANAFIDSVPKGGMVSPQVQELYMLVEYLGENVDKLKEQMESEIPMILKNDMVIQFHEERLIDLEAKKMETIKVVFAILMIQDGSTVEMVPTDGLSDCLKQKRTISRNIGEDQEGIYMSCKEVKAEVYEDMGRLKIKKIIE